MNVEIGTEAPQFIEKENINGIFVAVYYSVLFLVFFTALAWQMSYVSSVDKTWPLFSIKHIFLLS